MTRRASACMARSRGRAPAASSSRDVSDAHPSSAWHTCTHSPCDYYRGPEAAAPGNLTPAQATFS